MREPHDRETFYSAVSVGIASGLATLFVLMFWTIDFDDPTPARLSPGAMVLIAFLVGPAAGITVLAACSRRHQ